MTEKAYGIDRDQVVINERHPAIVQNLLQPELPQGVLGILVHAIKLRWQQNMAPLTVLSCDNLPANGRLLKTGTVDFAQRIDPALATYIQQQVTFPSTMVDRITPSPYLCLRACRKDALLHGSR